MLHQSCLINKTQKYDELVRRIKFYEITYKLNYYVVPKYTRVLGGILSISNDTVNNATHVVAGWRYLHINTPPML